MYKWLILLSILCVGTAFARTVWTWVDDNGQQHFSDRPMPGARQIELPDPQGASRPVAPRAAPAPASATRPQPQPSTERYTAFRITRPTQQETLWNIEGNLGVQVELTPPLQPGHQIDVFLDGQRVALNTTADQFTVPEVYRGLHTMQAAVVDSNGNEVVRSLAVTFMVQQTSILNQNNPNNAN